MQLTGLSRMTLYCLELAGQRQYQLVPIPQNLQHERLAARLCLAGDEPQVGGGVGAVGDHRMTGISAEPLQSSEFGAVPVQDSGAAGR